MKKTLLLGVGSILRGDDGLGVRAIDLLESQEFAKDLELVRGDISGLDLLKYFSDFKQIIIIDAAKMSQAPGTIKIFNSREIKKNNFKDTVSTHGIALSETLALAEKLGLESEITIIGVEPEDTTYKLGLSETITKRLPEVVEEVKGLLSTQNA